MIARNVLAGIIGLIIVITVIAAAVLGFWLLQQPSAPPSNETSTVTAGTRTATVTPSTVPATLPTLTPSGQQIVVTQGQTFTISLSANPSTGYEWKPTFDTATLSLRDHTFIRNPTSTLLVGVGGTDLFTFQALRVGATSVTFDYVSPEGQTTQSTSYSVVIR